jgi:chromosome segregation ATPase
MAKQTPPAGAGGAQKPRPKGKGKAPPPAASGQDLSSIRAADISFDEQIEIIGEINDVVEQNKIVIGPDTFSYAPRRRGAVVPLLVNVLAVIAVGLAGLVLFRVFSRQEQVLTGQAASLVTAEGKIIEALREESEAQLSEKDRQIAEIQSRLTQLRQDRERLKLEMDVRIQQREDELRTELARELEAERRNLQEAGVSAESIQEQLAALEARLTQERDQRLSAFRTEAEAELSEKDAEIARLVEQYNSSLERFRRERADLERQFAEREAEMREEARAEVQARTAAAESERTEIAGHLAQLQSERDRERAVLDQLLAQYNQVRVRMAAGRYGQALTGIDGIEAYLADSSVAAMPAIQRRLPIERFTLASLRELIRLQQAATGQVQAASQADTLLASIRDTVAAADRQAEAGNTATAIGLYQQAIDAIPEVARSHATLIEQATFGSLDQIQREMRDSEQALRRVQDELRQAQSRLGQQNREISRLQSAAASREALLQQLRDLRSRYASIQAGRAAAAAANQERVLELLEVKVKVRQALATEPIKSASPGLYEALEEYLQAYGQEQQQLGREAALAEVAAVLEGLTRRGTRVDLESMKSRYGGGPGDPFAQLLERLETLLR